MGAIIYSGCPYRLTISLERIRRTLLAQGNQIREDHIPDLYGYTGTWPLDYLRICKMRGLRAGLRRFCDNLPSRGCLATKTFEKTLWKTIKLWKACYNYPVKILKDLLPANALVKTLFVRLLAHQDHTVLLQGLTSTTALTSVMECIFSQDFSFAVGVLIDLPPSLIQQVARSVRTYEIRITKTYIRNPEKNHT